MGTKVHTEYNDLEDCINYWTGVIRDAMEWAAIDIAEESGAILDHKDDDEKLGQIFDCFEEIMEDLVEELTTRHLYWYHANEED